MPPIAKFLKEKCKYCKFLIYKNLVLVYNKGRIVRTRSSEYILRDYLMRKFPKTLLTIFTAAVMSAGAISLAACGASFTPADGIPSGEVSSNGGFVVEKGDYVYFINGVESSSSDNTYGSVVKGALMRAKKSDVESGKNGAEMIVPSLMVASDYTAGIFIYGERVYFATPSTTRDLSGNALNSYLDFKSAKLDGSDVVTYFNLEDSSTYYRFVEDGNSVYLVYERENDIISYNTSDQDEHVACGRRYVLCVRQIGRNQPRHLLYDERAGRNRRRGRRFGASVQSDLPRQRRRDGREVYLYV